MVIVFIIDGENFALVDALFLALLFDLAGEEVLHFARIFDGFDVKLLARGIRAAAATACAAR